MRISTTMRDALVALTNGGDGAELPDQTVDALERRQLVHYVQEEDLRHLEVTQEGRMVLADEFKRRREKLPEPPTGSWDHRGPYWIRDTFAAALGVSGTAVYLWESGRRPIAPVTWRALEGLELEMWMRYRLPEELEGALGEFGRWEQLDPPRSLYQVANALRVSAGLPEEPLAVAEAEA